MAIYHYSIKIISRGKGKSAVAAAAYRAGTKIINDYDGICHDYTKKQGVVHTEILLPNHASQEYVDRATLWNAVERVESNRNAQLAREIELALPKELSLGQNIALARDYVQRTFADKGMCADICIHDTGAGNPHAHVMLTMRPIEQDGEDKGKWGAKSKKEYILNKNGERIRLPSGEYKSRKINTTDWNEQTRADEWRERWATAVNATFERLGMTERIDHRSYERQGLNILPTVHLGVAASQMEKKGIVTDRGNHNRQVTDINNEMRQTRARITKLRKWLYSRPLTNHAPSLIDIMDKVAKWKNVETNWQALANIQTRAAVLMFLSNNKIGDMSELSGKVEQLHGEFRRVTDTVKAAERRLTTLATHLAHFENHKQYQPIYKKYISLPENKRDAYYDKYSEQIDLYQDAKAHFDACMNGRKTLPVNGWRSEEKELLEKRSRMVEQYYRLKEDVRNVEALRRGVEQIMREDIQRTKPAPTQDMVL